MDTGTGMAMDTGTVMGTMVASLAMEVILDPVLMKLKSKLDRTRSTYQPTLLLPLLARSLYIYE